jgi:RNA polymerase sigma-54 factor
MRLDVGQHARLDQRTKLAPRMIQSMEILQMSQQALEERIEQELASNPTLELKEQTEEEAEGETAGEDAQQTESSSDEQEMVVSGEEAGDTSAADFERLTDFSEEYGESWEANTYETGSAPVPSGRPQEDGERDAKLDAMANTAARGASLYDQLLQQWHLVEVDQATARAGEYLIGFIDSDGYLRTDWQAILDQAPRDVSEADLQRALTELQQSLEPAGLAARDVRECLLNQIAVRQQQAPEADWEAERAVVAQHLKDLEGNRLPRIAKDTGYDIERIKQAIHNLRQFHLHPGKLLVEDEPHTITPDAIIEYDEQQDRYIVRLTHGNLPALDINQSYQKLARDRQQDKKTRQFVTQNLRSARWLIDAIQQRNATLLRVIQVVADAQRPFFEEGPQALQPLPMTQVADQLGVHVATVSRAVHEKYVQTPRGIYPLRMFFSGGTETESGESVSWTAIQARLEELINQEDKSNPLSDDALVEKLKEHGIDIARRTVAKYRKQLSMPPARQRKEY